MMDASKLTLAVSGEFMIWSVGEWVWWLGSVSTFSMGGEKVGEENSSFTNLK